MDASDDGREDDKDAQLAEGMVQRWKKWHHRRCGTGTQIWQLVNSWDVWTHDAQHSRPSSTREPTGEMDLSQSYRDWDQLSLVVL